MVLPPREIPARVMSLSMHLSLSIQRMRQWVAHPSLPLWTAYCDMIFTHPWLRPRLIPGQITPPPPMADPVAARAADPACHHRHAPHEWVTRRAAPV